MDDVINNYGNTKIAVLVVSSNLVPQKSLFTASSFCRPFSSMKSKGNGGKRSRMGATSPLYPLGRAGTPSRRPPRGRISLPPPPPKSRNVPGGSNSPIPRFVRILKGLVVSICLPHHRGFVIGARLKRKSGRTKKTFPSRRKVFASA